MTNKEEIDKIILLLKENELILDKDIVNNSKKDIETHQKKLKDEGKEENEQ